MLGHTTEEAAWAVEAGKTRLALHYSLLTASPLTHTPLTLLQVLTNHHYPSELKSESFVLGVVRGE